MENLNAEQVKKALGSCHPIGATRCKECPYSKNGSVNILFTETHTCYDQMAIDALALINSQEQRIGELEKRLRYLLQSKTIAEYDEVDIHTKEYVKDIHSLDANIKEFAEENEKLWKASRHLAQIVIEAAVGDPIAKEMLEDAE